MTDNTIAPPIREHGEGVNRETLIRAMYDAWPHTVTSQALNELTGLPYGATIPYSMAQKGGASFVALERYADGILALSAQPVKGDALAEEERAHTLTIEQRDRAEEAADLLAHDIARITGVDIGEHSNLNCPWANAHEAAEDFAQPVKDAVLREALEAVQAWDDKANPASYGGLPDRVRRVVDAALSPKSPASVGLDPAKQAFTFAFARGFQIAEETSRSCLSAMDDAWEEYQAALTLEDRP
jgi:hypothetical protein